MIYVDPKFRGEITEKRGLRAAHTYSEGLWEYPRGGLFSLFFFFELRRWDVVSVQKAGEDIAPNHILHNFPITYLVMYHNTSKSFSEHVY